MRLRSTDLAEDLGTGGKILEKLSKEISYALRHAPWEYELEMDEEGLVPIAQLLMYCIGQKKGRISVNRI